MIQPATFRVTLTTRDGQAVIDVPCFQGPQAAERRAFWTAVHAGWGDIDEVQVVQTRRVPAAAAA